MSTQIKKPADTETDAELAEAVHKIDPELGAKVRRRLRLLRLQRVVNRPADDSRQASRHSLWRFWRRG